MASRRPISLRPLTDQIGEHPVDADDRQRDRDGGKGQEHEHGETASSERRVDKSCEPADVCEGQQWIEPGHVVPKRGNGGDAIRRRAHSDGEGVHRMLLVRQVDLCRRVLVEAAILDVPHDADDGLRSVARVARELRADSNLLSNGVLSREVSLVRSVR